MQKVIKNIKLVLLDVDNTALCLKMYDYEGKNDKELGTRIIGIKDDMEWLRYNINNNAYIHCEAPVEIVNIVNYVKSRGGMVMGLTECKNSFEYNSKFNRLRECYSGSFLHHGELISIDTRHNKVAIIKMLAERDEISLDEILFIDDSFTEVMEAANEGIIAMHTTEALMRFRDMDDLKTNGIKG